MMKCKEIRSVTKCKKAFSPVDAIKALAHVKACPVCHDLLLLDRLAPAIIKAASKSGLEVAYSDRGTALINKIRARMQEMTEQRSRSWELAVEGMRGWLAAFAITAIILIAVSIQWRPSVITSDFEHEGDELVTQNPAEYLIRDVPDPIAFESTGVGKDNPYAHK